MLLSVDNSIGEQTNGRDHFRILSILYYNIRLIFVRNVRMRHDFSRLCFFEDRKPRRKNRGNTWDLLDKTSSAKSVINLLTSSPLSLPSQIRSWSLFLTSIDEVFWCVLDILGSHRNKPRKKLENIMVPSVSLDGSFCKQQKKQCSNNKLLKSLKKTQNKLVTIRDEQAHAYAWPEYIPVILPRAKKHLNDVVSHDFGRRKFFG